MKTQIQIVGDAATSLMVSNYLKMAGQVTNSQTINKELINLERIDYDNRFIDDMHSTAELLDLDWYDGYQPQQHVEYIQHLDLKNGNDCTKLLLILTSSGNKTILRFDHETGEDLEDGYCHIAFKGTRGRFVEDLYSYAGILNGYAIQGSNIENIEGANVMPPDFYESTGPEDMLPWEIQGTYLIRIYEQGDVQPLLRMVRWVYSRELTWESKPKMSSNEELICNFYMGNVEGAEAVIESILDARWALQQAVDKL